MSDKGGDVERPAVADDPFRWGWRPRMVTGPDGGRYEERLPLTREDLLHPELGDVIVERPIHELDRAYLAMVFRRRPLRPPVSFVASELRVDFNAEDIRPMSPDVSVFVGLRETPSLRIGTLELAEAGGKCVLAVEVVSPDYRENDTVEKLRLYHRIGIETYIIVDQDGEDGPRRIVAYRHTPGGYVPIRAEARGGVRIPRLGLRIGLRGEDQRVVCHDLATGAMIGDYDEVSVRLEEAEQTLEESDRVQAELREELEEAATRQRAARLEAEAARRDAEASDMAREAERTAREAAETAAVEERRLRLATEDRLRAMEEMLRTLQGGAVKP